MSPSRSEKQAEPYVDQPRLTREEHYAFWTERLTPEERHEVAAGLDFLSTEGRVEAA